MSKSIAKNLSYNVLLQVVLMVLPLISIPYVSRVLGADGIGAYSFTLSMTQYFIILGTLGTALYGNRQIAYTRDDKTHMSKTFWSILIVRISTTLIALMVYYAMFWNATTLRELRFIQSIHILAQMIDVSWLFIGHEDFKRIVTRNLFVKLVGLTCIFLFVKTSNDVALYTWINLGMSAFSSLIMWIYVPQIVEFVRLEAGDVKAHIQPILKLFIPQIASQVYVLLDKTMIGLLSTIEQVGFYTQAERIVRAILEVTSALGVVMLPRMSHIFAKGEHEKMDEYLNKSLLGVTYISIPMMVGLIAVTHEFVPWFFGPGYTQVEILMMMISPILMFISLSSVLGVQYLLPVNRVNQFTISIVTGAVVNLILNSLLIPRIDALGAVIGTIAAEFSVMAVQVYFLKDKIDIPRYLKGFFKYVIAAGLMLIAVRLIGASLGSSALTNLVQAGIGALIYIVTLSVLKDETHGAVLGVVFQKAKSVLKLKN